MPVISALMRLIVGASICLSTLSIAPAMGDCTGCGSPSSYEDVPVCGQCVHFAYRYVRERYGITMPNVSYAYQMWNLNVPGMDEIANDGTNYPQHGDVLIWNANSCGALSAGHVAIVDCASSRSSVTVVDSNWCANNCECGSRHTVAICSGMPGWLRRHCDPQSLPAPPDPGGGTHIQYCAHVQNVGWQGWVQDGQDAGTTGQSLRMEAIAMRSLGPHIYYSAHVQCLGWQPWVQDGAVAGTTCKFLRVEAIKVTTDPGYSISYQAQVQGYGWMAVVSDGAVAGTTGQEKRLEALRVWITALDTTPPDISLSPEEIATWRNGTQSVSWNVMDNRDVAEVRVWWNGEGQSGVGANGSTPMREGVNTFHIWARDSLNNARELDRVYRLDTASPSVSLTYPAVNSWSNTNQSISWTVTDATSGVGSVTLQWDSGPQTSVPASGTAQIPEGKHNATIRAADVAANTSSQSGGQWWIDTTPPVPSVTFNPLSPNGENGWYTVDPTMRVSAVDPNGSDGSGVQNHFYSVDGSEHPYTGQVTIPDGGVHSVVGRATDIAGNSGELVAEVKVDTTAPMFSAIHTLPESGVLDTLSASWDCDDPDSGIAEYEYSIYREAGDTDELLAGPVTTTEPYAQEMSLALARGESYYFVVRAKNNAGLYNNYIASDAITATDATRDVAPGMNSGGVSVPAEARTSTNYMLTDSLGQFVVDTSTSSGLVLESGYWHSEIETTTAETVAAAKGIDNNDLIQLGSPTQPVVVTVAPGVFADRFYVEQPDRSSGIAVSFGPGLGMFPVPIPGDRVWIIGTTGETAGERVIQCAAPNFVFHGDPLGALFVNNAWLGGADVNEFTKGIEGAAGLNNIGILIKTSGRVGKVDAAGAYFYISDGSNLSDGTTTGGEANVGVRVAGDGRGYAPGQFVTVTGISSCFIDGNGKRQRLIRPLSVEPLE